MTSAMKEKLLALIADAETAEQMGRLRNESEAMAFFRYNGIEVDSIDEVRQLLKSTPQELSFEELEQVSGGCRCGYLGVGYGSRDRKECTGFGV